ncbi:uncharacterized protein ARMOST_11532 [Armillaria ostoyae]|uniref:Heterokaryon incompatibility domain-containing protein n=1 Tax=Armillaria ostoyae TaxID=47428 RepID=A0A284RHC6_ARMOS|nr:uncharacterized protein ARMOST_11532 [Armillaria ostoyae]
MNPDGEKWYWRYHDDIGMYRHDYEWYDVRLPEVILTPPDPPIGTGQSASIPVLKQRSYTGRDPVIPSALADTLCSDLGIQGLLENLNATLGTSHTLFTPWVYSVLGDCISENYDFGTAFAYLRPFWYYYLTAVVDDLPKCKVRYREMLQNVLVENTIIHTHVPPRRVWDLYSNRVVPWWDIVTPINGCEWPVPVPKNTSLDHIRIEMLNLGAEYVWLDVLCLRQKGGRREDPSLREEEWKVDVPTIGNVYRRAERVVYYLSGLGQPLSSNTNDLESDRCWFKRAWTLQETSWNSIIAGDTGDEWLQAKFGEKVSSLQKTEWILYDALSEMQKRVSTHPVDKVAGLAYLLRSLRSIPVYCGAQSEEDAWMALMVSEWDKLLLLFLHPTPGNGTQSWRPSWEQVMTEKLPSQRWGQLATYNGGVQLVWTAEAMAGAYIFNNGFIIELALVRGLSEGDSQGQE